VTAVAANAARTPRLVRREEPAGLEKVMPVLPRLFAAFRSRFKKHPTNGLVTQDLPSSNRVAAVTPFYPAVIGGFLPIWRAGDRFFSVAGR
jgi:hypothetical protein